MKKMKGRNNMGRGEKKEKITWDGKKMDGKKY